MRENQIEIILKDCGYDIDTIKNCSQCNGCGPKGFNIFEKIVYKIPGFDYHKYDKLIEDMNLICNCHDVSYLKGGNIIDFLKANYILGVNMMRLFHRANITRRFVIFSLFFITTTLFGWKYFNWG